MLTESDEELLTYSPRPPQPYDAAEGAQYDHGRDSGMMRSQSYDDEGNLADAQHQQQDDPEDRKQRRKDKVQDADADSGGNRVLGIATDFDTGVFHEHNIPGLHRMRKCSSDLNN